MNFQVVIDALTKIVTDSINFIPNSDVPAIIVTLEHCVR
jgi:hypothetical protein